ncbi:MAG: cellulase family glycosylhydrolase, partial [Myxococcales bacterium]|nr:cellulase family glycosylhydrolase [Myxococcales bacterium]
MTSLKLHPVWELARLLTALLMLVGCVDDGDPEDLASQTNAVKKKGITVSGHKVMRNGHRFISRGVIFEGFQFPKDAMEACEAPPQKAKDQDFCDRHLLAMDYVLNGDALDRAKQSWKANTVRFNVNQALLDPSSALHDKKDESGKKWGDKYLNLLDNAVQKARDKNMVVMIALFSGRLDRADKVYVDGKRLNPLVFDHKF